MRNWALGLVFAASAGTAVASDPADLRTYQQDDYAARAYYRMDFSGDGRRMQSLGLRFDSERASANGAPALFLASFGEQGLQKLAVSGVDLRGAMLSANTELGSHWYRAFTGLQWMAVGFTAFVFTTVAIDASSSSEEDAATSGSGSGGN